MQPGPVITTLWIAFLVLWLVAAAWSDRSAKRAGNAGQRGSRIAIAIGALLLAVPTRDSAAPARLWPATWTDACVCLLAAGFAFSWWARLHLDRLWSARVETKAGHRVVDTGPYGIVRHPIYTGILLAVVATATAERTITGVVGAVAMTIGCWLKARSEERWLAQELPTGDYAFYRRRVPMLLPFGPKGP
jgi:protein-S-isoprenylcysteine O-methyltransferase Ste14